MIISMDKRLHRLMKSVKSKEELSAIERRITRYEIANSVVERPVVRWTIPPRKVLIAAYTIKQTSGKSSVIFSGTKR